MDSVKSSKKSKEKTQKIAPIAPSDTYNYIIYGYEKPKKVNGILGTIDFHCIHMLLMNGNECIREKVPEGCDIVQWYVDVLEGQDIHVDNSYHDINTQTVWICVDLKKTPIHEFTGWRDNYSPGSLVWRTYWFPTQENTTKECLGFEVCAKKQYVHPQFTLSDIIHTIIKI